MLNSSRNGETLAEVDESLIFKLEWMLKEMVTEEDEDLDPHLHQLVIGWREEGPDFAAFLRTHVFVGGDQFVVPSHNLETAKQILRRNEGQKKALPQMGFIEVRNMRRG